MPYGVLSGEWVNNSIAERLIIIYFFKRFHIKQLEYITKDHIVLIQYFESLKRLHSLVPCVLNNIILLITWNCSYVARASTSFECLNMCHATFTFIIEALLRLATYVMYSHFTLLLKWIDGFYSGSLHLLGWFLWRTSMLRLCLLAILTTVAT